MPRTATILGLLLTLALLVVGASWIGSPVDVGDEALATEAPDDAVEPRPDVEPAEELREAAPLADVLEPESATRVAID
jgi:hypothetical protein